MRLTGGIGEKTPEIGRTSDLGYAILAECLSLQRVLSLLLGCLLITGTVRALDFRVIDLEHQLQYVDGITIGNFIGDPNQDLMLIGRDQQRQKYLQVMALQQGQLQSEQSYIQMLDQQVMFYDTARLAHQTNEVLVFLLPDRVAYFDVQSKQLKTLVKTRSIYRPSHAQTSKLSQLSLVHDVNGDQLSDLIITDFEQTYVFVQAANGEFAAAQSLDMLAQRRIYFNDSSIYISADLAVIDFNSDGNTDIVYRVDNQLYVFFQKTTGFNRQALVLPLKLADPLMNRYEQLDEDQSDLTVHTFFEMLDLNRDGHLDLITQMTKSSGLLDKSSSYQVYLGQPGKSHSQIPSKPNSIIRSEGMQFELNVVDFNDDGDLDLISPSYELGIGSIIASLFSSSADLDVAFHPLIENKGYLSDPISQREITVEFDLSSGQRVYPLMLIEDFTGDGRKDLLTGDGAKKLYLRPAHKAHNKRRLFAAKAQRFRVPLPKDGRLVSAKQLNDDNKVDLIIRYTSLDDGDLYSRIKLLLTK